MKYIDEIGRSHVEYLYDSLEKTMVISLKDIMQEVLEQCLKTNSGDPYQYEI